MSCKGKCFFCQANRCKLSKNCCCICFSYIEKIDDSLDFKDHLHYIENNKRFYTTLAISIVSLIFSFSLLLLKLNDNSTKKPASTCINCNINKKSNNNE
jgi:hypothetical protein